jgi:hypothetical protein
MSFYDLTFISSVVKIPLEIHKLKLRGEGGTDTQTAWWCRKIQPKPRSGRKTGCISHLFLLSFSGIQRRLLVREHLLSLKIYTKMHLHVSVNKPSSGSLLPYFAKVMIISQLKYVVIKSVRSCGCIFIQSLLVCVCVCCARCTAHSTHTHTRGAPRTAHAHTHTHQ